MNGLCPKTYGRFATPSPRSQTEKSTSPSSPRRSKSSILLKIGAEMGKEKETVAAFAKILVGSIGPVTTEELKAHGIAADMEPSHPKMGFLVNEVAQRSAELLAKKRAAADTSAAASN